MNKKIYTAKDYAGELFLTTVRLDENGRRIGYSYTEMLAMIHRRFPTITYPGPHLGKPIRMDVKRLRELLYILQAENRQLIFPVRPRSKRPPRAKRKEPAN